MVTFCQRLKLRSIATYLIVVWMILNILLFIAIIASGDEEDLNN